MPPRRLLAGLYSLVKELQTAEAKSYSKGNGSLARSRIPRDGLARGTDAPDFRLPLLEGGELALSSYRGRSILLVFSDPECGPCSLLAPQLERLHRSRSAIQILVVSHGDIALNRAKAEELDLTFPIVLQRHWEISRKYAMFVTPMAYLIDEDGVIMSDVAVGADAILALTGPSENALAGRIRERQAQLYRELEKGQLEIQRVEREQAQLRETVLRISGALQVLAELLADEQ